MQENSTDPHPLGNLAYDWVTLVQNKAQALMAYDLYIKDAEAAGSAECAAFFRKVHDTDKAQLAEAKQHLVKVLQGKMGGHKGPGRCTRCGCLSGSVPQVASPASSSGNERYSG